MHLKKFLQDVERKIIETTLIAHGGNIEKTGQYFQIKRTTMVLKIKKYKIDIDSIKGRDPIKFIHQVPEYHISGLNNLKFEAALKALKECQYNKKMAADMVGVSVNTMREWIKYMRSQGIQIPQGAIYRNPSVRTLQD